MEEIFSINKLLFQTLYSISPAAVLGFIFNDYIDQLLERVEVVAITLILGGIVFLFIDNFFNNNKSTEEPSFGFCS
ncbi:MAG: undecaprenyl-diphosphate phosphatase [Cyclobacteriaceae bacterium]